ncbi:MAG TPA: bifunctional hydroxymethylpyrimidine kinase/phosphomethylpyrimidine kinase, partial [Candidatus Bathyarchaeota archaeon]|nr:bifunctional hydroxymethylpyrimidine kinase/phosphomethylpyrimidine kinase [Candidatus Bathyarchaeota archaeon]
YILEAMSREPMFRAALNIRYSEKILRKLRDKGLLISSYDRREEPEHVKRVEGATIPWGMKTAIERVGRVPDVVYHLGDWGKEPMIVLLGEDPVDLARMVASIGEELYEVD